MMRIRILMIAALIGGTLKTAAQGFFNLTAEQVRIDTLLPYFTYIHELEGNYADSSYTVSIDYPEFVTMTRADIERYRMITSDTLPAMPKVYSGLAVSRKKGSLDIAFVPLVFRDGKYMKLVSFKLTVKAKPLETSTGFSSASDSTLAQRIGSHNTRQRLNPADRYADHSVLRSGSWAKIRVPRSGVFQITDELVRQAGFSDPSRVKVYGYGGELQPEILTDGYLRSTDDLQEVPTCVVDGRRLFYAKGPVSWNVAGNRVRNPYSDYGYYFLTESDGAPLAVDEQTFVNSFYPGDIHKNSIYEVDDFAWYHSGRNLYDARTFSPGISRSYTVPAAGEDGNGRLYVALTADAASTALVSINGVTAGKVTVSGSTTEYIKALSGSATFRVSNISSSNTITISQASGGTMRLDYIAILCENPCGSPNIHGADFASPEFVYRITNQDHHADGPADMIILLPTSQKLRAQAERLKELHETHDGMRVRIVPADELFNEFSSGTPDATAYRRYLKMLYDRAATEEDMPRYLVLFGDGVWDNRMRTSSCQGLSPDDFLLCFESENSFSATDSYVAEDFFCLLDDGERMQEPNGNYLGKPDVAVGRFPVRTEEEARTMVDKIENYLTNKNAGAWQNTIVMMGDDGNGNVHMKAADNIAKMLEKDNPAFDIKRVMWDAYERTSSATGNTYPDVSRLIRQYMASGALMMNYSGHGSASMISHEKVIDINDFRSISSAGLPLWITASCDIMPFDSQEDNIGEAALFNKSGGAVAFFGTTRTVYTDRNERINTAFTKALFNVTSDGSRNSIGEAVRLAKNSLVTTASGSGTYPDASVNKLHYALLGDPALRLAIPKLTTVIDRINDTPVDTDTPMQLKAGMQVRVEGHVEQDGQKASGFNGIISTNVRDAIQTIECRLNNTGSDGASTKFVYQDRPNSIFKGNDAVRDGDFSFSFIVPKDISYSDEPGQMIVFAVSDDHSMTAHGHTENIVLNGSTDFNPDEKGPSIYCYLNSPSFTNGDKVNSTPYFYAEINDDDGINVAGGGIGHDLQLIIDGDQSTTYTLNDYFAFDFGSYRSGRVGFSVPRLAPGDHKLLFRAWDVLNYSSTAELAFTVVEGMEPSIVDVDCYPNPATTSTTFRIVHDRIGSNVCAMLDIFDMSGRYLWSQETDAVPSDNTMTVGWNLTMGNGSRLGTGVYLYRVRLNCEGGSYVSKAKKLIILSNK